MNDYETVAKVIRYLDEHHTDQPNLAHLAKSVGLSAFHFHRLFSAWAGITPKNFLQCLTLAHVKKLLLQSSNVLDAALDAGLSGPGRLHDLCVNLEAASPGELKAGGGGWEIVFGYSDTPFGECILGEGPRGICHLAFVEPGKRKVAFADLEAAWPQARFERDDKRAVGLAGLVFQRQTAEPPRPLRAFVNGTAFQVKVWRALLRVPAGSVISYGHLAAAIGQPHAARAVGSAVARNSVAYLIPCHRVIRETGLIGEYRWGQARKRAMVGWEHSRASFDSEAIEENIDATMNERRI